MDIKTGGEEVLTRRERERAAHRQEIMNAAIRVFAKRGFGGATLDEVAQEAEFSKGALYLYFTSKEDILYNTLYSMSVTIIGAFMSTLSGTKSFREELRDLLIGTAEFSFKNHDYMKVVMAQHVEGFIVLSEESRQKITGLHNEVISTLRDRTRKAYEDNELRNLPIEAISSMIHGSIDSMAIMRWNLESLDQAQGAVDVYLDILFNGIAKEKEKHA